MAVDRRAGLLPAFGISSNDLFGKHPVQDRRRAVRIERTPEIERGRVRTFGVQFFQPCRRFDEGRHVIVGDPPDDVTWELRLAEPLGTQRQGVAMKVCVRESEHRLQASPERQRSRNIRVKLIRKEPRADKLPPTVPACLWIEMGATDETLAPFRYFVNRRDPIDKAFRTRMAPRFVQDAKCHECDSCHVVFSNC